MNPSLEKVIVTWSCSPGLYFSLLYMCLSLNLQKVAFWSIQGFKPTSELCGNNVNKHTCAQEVGKLCCRLASRKGWLHSLIPAALSRESHGVGVAGPIANSVVCGAFSNVIGFTFQALCEVLTNALSCSHHRPYRISAVTPILQS